MRVSQSVHFRQQSVHFRQQAVVGTCVCICCCTAPATVAPIAGRLAVCGLSADMPLPWRALPPQPMAAADQPSQAAPSRPLPCPIPSILLLVLTCRISSRWRHLGPAAPPRSSWPTPPPNSCSALYRRRSGRTSPWPGACRGLPFRRSA